jgi:3',5'-cyclic AMP phosphodiesterase CpdA/thymidylate synthase
LIIADPHEIVMSLLLHLSDLHLGNAPGEDVVGDYKIEAVMEADRVTRARLLRNTLKALAERLTETGETLDGIIITGDVTTQGRQDGFKELPGLLAALGTALPDPGHVVVVPGNHDVTWGTGPGTRERYRLFIDSIRAAGYVTPLLDGIDYDRDEPAAGVSPLLVGSDFVVAAVNSADMCGVPEPFSPAAAAELERLVAAAVISEDLQAQIRRVRTYDMPRISDRQMSALAGMLDQMPAGLVRIVALHHHLVPVRPEEEVKPFEAIVNLGAFNTFLGAADIDVVAHGHKHAANVQTLALTGASGERRFAVLSSCGTIGNPLGTGDEIAKLIRIHSDLPTLRRVEILSIPAVGSGSRLRSKIASVYDQPTWRMAGATPITVISGAAVTDVHEQLLEVAQRTGRAPMRDVICVVDNGSTALTPPATYPWPERSATELSTWFDDIVGWWQNPERADGESFTHGQRLRDWSGDQSCDQLSAIVSILSTDPGSSRGVAVLMNPKSDSITDRAVAFPSFSLLHMWIDDNLLHCSAFFRKQEMAYWWPVNMAEIARLQAEVLQRLHSSHELATAGAIRTYASKAVFSDRLPKVDVPLVDRVFWRDAKELRVLAVAVADGDMPGRDKDIATLLSFMDDWAPGEEGPPVDGAAVPVRGLDALAEMLDPLAVRYLGSPAREVSELLREIDEANKSYLRERNTGDPSRTYARWRGRLVPKLARLRELLARSPASDISGNNPA